ncbi:MAG: hypothetical protein IH612_18015 [Desulfofustis sp.]|nr:hypothetical protein [Desulfofustis sp.]
MAILFRLSICAALFVLASCSAHSPLIGMDVTDVEQKSETIYDPHSEKIYLSTEMLPEAGNYEVIAKVDVGKAWYGSAHAVYEELAESARQLGGDAVYEIHTWFQPTGWACAAPHGAGIVIKVKDHQSFAFSDTDGQWL